MSSSGEQPPFPIRSDQEVEVAWDLHEACDIIRSLAGALAEQKKHPGLNIIDKKSLPRLEIWAENDRDGIDLSAHQHREAQERRTPITEQDVGTVVATAMRGLNCCRPQHQNEGGGAA